MVHRSEQVAPHTKEVLCEPETWGDPFITASGRRVFDGVVACPRALPFGTKVRIGDRVGTAVTQILFMHQRLNLTVPSRGVGLSYGTLRVPEIMVVFGFLQ